MGVASWCGEQEVGVASGRVESMGVATGCGCKEIYRFPHSTYPTPLVSVLFYSSIPTYCSLKKKLFVLYSLSSHYTFYH